MEFHPCACKGPGPPGPPGPPGKTGNKALPLLDDTAPTLDELGLTKRESADAQLLMETERAKGAQGTGNNQFKKVVQSPDVTAPTLAQLGLTKRESADAQLLAELPAEDFEKIKFVASKNTGEHRRVGYTKPLYLAFQAA